MNDIQAAAQRLKSFLAPTPLRSYAPLDTAVNCGAKIFIKHENHHPTNTFKARNALSALLMLKREEKSAGVIAASRGNHGQGLAWAGRQLNIPVTICVPMGNNPEKNEAMRGWGARVIEIGHDYDEAILAAGELAEQKDLAMIHATNNPHVLAGAATVSLEILEQMPQIDALVIPVGGGSLAAGAIAAAQAMNHPVKIYGVQSEQAAAVYESWHAGQPVTWKTADTIADGLATRQPYPMTFELLRKGLQGFVTVSEQEIADSLTLMIRTTHNLCEGASAAGLAGLMKLKNKLAGRSVGLILSGSNIDQETLRNVLNGSVRSISI